MSFVTRLVTLALIALSLPLAGCPLDELALDPGDSTIITRPSPGAAADPDALATLSPISENGTARYADLAVGRDGTWHALFQDTNKATGAPQIYYRASSDGGASWSNIENLTSVKPDAKPGFLKLAIDGQGRVYALWKDDVDNSDGRSGGIYEGTLVYRVLEAGGWSPLVTIGTPQHALSWYPAVDPSGQLHVVWNEEIKGKDGYYTYAWESPLVQQAALTGATVGAPKTLLAPEPVEVTGTSLIRYHGYEGLQGYVDAAGQAHFVAEKMLASPDEAVMKTNPQRLVLFDGAQERDLMPTTAFLGPSERFRHPPVLYRDAAGRDHLIAFNQIAERPALEDRLLSALDTPTDVYRLKSANGAIKGFQVAPGPNGQLLALMAFYDTGKAETYSDLYAAHFDGTAWGPARNVTANAAREDLASKATGSGTSVSKLVTYSAQYGAGAPLPGGRWGLLLVNTAIESYMRQNSVGGGAFGATSNTLVFQTTL